MNRQKLYSKKNRTYYHVKSNYLVAYKKGVWNWNFTQEFKDVNAEYSDSIKKIKESFCGFIDKRREEIWNNGMRPLIVFPPVKNGYRNKFNFLKHELKFQSIGWIEVHSCDYEKLKNTSSKYEREEVMEEAIKTWTHRMNYTLWPNTEYYYIFVDDISTSGTTIKYMLEYVDSKIRNIKTNNYNFVTNAEIITMAKTVGNDEYRYLEPELSKELNDRDSRLQNITWLDL